MRPRIVRIQLAVERGGPRVQVESAIAAQEWGLAGDAYGGPGDRQVVVMSHVDRAAVDDALFPTGLCYPRFRENLLVAGLDVERLIPGTRFSAGGAIFEVTPFAKRCFPECTLPRDECRIRSGTFFCRVVSGGPLRVDDDIHL